MLPSDAWLTLAEGFGLTLRLSASSAVLAIVIGLALNYSDWFECGWLKTPLNGFAKVLRQTPLLIQLFVWYRGLGSLGLPLPAEICGVLALSLYSGAFLQEVFRGALEALPRPQQEAGLALGLTRWQTFTKILVPQAMPIALPPTANTLISLVKNSSLVAFIAVEDLFFVVLQGAIDQFKPLEYFSVGLMLYGLTCWSLGQLTAWLERRYQPITQREPVIEGAKV